MTTETRPMTWCGLPAELHLSHAPVSPARVAEALRIVYPENQVSANGRTVVMTRPRGDTDTWIGSPVDEDAVRAGKLERFAELVGPVISRTDILSLVRDEGRITGDERFEIVELADWLGVAAK